MTNTQEQIIKYKCPKCGYDNVWQRAEILQRGQAIIYRSDEPHTRVRYSLRCKNPGGCDGRMVVELDKE
ncbi:hypothetical protein Cagg_0854 [Chloroflexus aggregans DSM 9485]|uniref:Uncharacterized protein n=1 Tax=Chloroflexus aggregans (strain MD-66 / DSM 9485) TaxID=326427 RepID=B8G5R4_CHLAD|nr:hypothetical protein Cagg_0854 [Chloroflexus aggregans DSM 9485]